MFHTRLHVPPVVFTRVKTFTIIFIAGGETRQITAEAETRSTFTFLSLVDTFFQVTLISL